MYKYYLLYLKPFFAVGFDRPAFIRWAFFLSFHHFPDIYNFVIMNYSTISAILRGRWLIDTSYAETQLPLIVGMIKNHQVNFAYRGENLAQNEQKQTEATLMATVAGKAVYKVGKWTEMTSLPDGTIAFVDLVGPVMKYGGMCSYGSIDHANILRKLDNAPNVSGVILNVDSPGGQVDGTTLLADQVKAMGKPIIAMVDDGLMASAAMWIGSAANEIYATKKSDSFGSIGVYATLYDWNAYLKKEGIPVHEIYAPQSEEKNKDYRDALNGDYSGMKDDLRQIADTFIETISENRPKAVSQKDKWSKGGMFNAKEATKMGLIDGIKSFEQIVDRISTLASKFSINKKQNTMSAGAFQKTIAAAKVDAFEVVENGFLLSEEAINNIDTELATLATQVEDLTSAAEQSRIAFANVEAANTEITGQRDAAQARVTELESELSTLNAATIAPINTARSEDEFGADPEAKYMTSVDVEAARLRARRK
jgi:protease IV